MRIALSEMSIEGIKTNIALHQELMLDAASWRAAPASTTWSKNSPPRRGQQGRLIVAESRWPGYL
jgi:biotin carboxylase